MTTKELLVTCPHCKKTFSYYDSKYRPFCCERCRMVDLGVWLEEGYRMPVKPDELEDEEELPEHKKNKDADED